MKKFSYYGGKKTLTIPRDPHGLDKKPLPRKRNFGVELEIGVDIDKEENFLQEVSRRIPNRAYWSHDGGGIELSSVPYLLGGIRHYLDSLLTNLPYTADVIGRERTGRGMHVHVSNYGMDPTHNKRLIAFMAKDATAKFRNWVGRRNNDWSHSNYHWLMEDYKKVGCTQRMGIAINTRHGTHEFRLFRTTLNPFVAKANVDFVRAVCDYTSPTAQMNCESVEDFISFVMLNANAYPFFANRITRSRVSEYRQMAVKFNTQIVLPVSHIQKRILNMVNVDEQLETVS